MWKTEWAPIFNFQVGKWGLESRGTLRDPEGVEMGGTPAWDPHFTTRKLKIGAHSVFHTVFRNCYWKWLFPYRLAALSWPFGVFCRDFGVSWGYKRLATSENGWASPLGQAHPFLRGCQPRVASGIAKIEAESSKSQRNKQIGKEVILLYKWWRCN